MLKLDAILVKIGYLNIITNNLSLQLNISLFMLRLRFYIIILLTIVCFFILFPYFIIQTSVGARIISQQLSKLSPYSISIGRINHSFSNLSELVFDNVILRDGQQNIVKISKLIVGLDKNDLWQLKHFNYIIVVNGKINGDKVNYNEISANTLKFVDSTVNLSINKGQNKLSLQQLNGGIKPFAVSGKEKYEFDLTAQQVLFNQMPMKSVLIQGYHQDNITSITNLGGNINNGFFVSKLKILADNSFDIEQLKINNIHFQLSNEDDLNKLPTVFPKFTIRQFLMLESSIQLPNFSFDKGNIEATDISYDKQWQFDKSSFVFNAETAMWHDDLFSSILIKLKSEEQAIKIEKVMATWNKGNVNFTGSWQDNQLRLTQLTLVGANYELPGKLEWPLLPDIFSQINIEQLTILPSMLIETNPDYPFIFTNLEVSGSNISLVKDGKLGLYSGTIFFKAEKGSINRIDITYPDLVVKFDDYNCAILNFSTLINQGGMLESIATLDPSQTEFLSLKFNAYNIDSSLLKEWRLVKKPPRAMNYKADLHGKILPFNLSGIISVEGNDYIVTSEH